MSKLIEIGELVLDRLGSHIWNQALDYVESRVSDQVLDQVYDQVVAQVEDRVSDPVYKHLILAPGVYVQILPTAQVNLNGVPTNIVGVVGTAIWGPKKLMDELIEIGKNVRQQVWNQAFDQAWVQVRNHVWYQVWNQLLCQMGNALYEQVCFKVEDQLNEDV